MALKNDTILGVRVDSTSIDKVLRFISIRIEKNRKFYIVTPNPEIVLLAQNDFELSRALRHADISIVDGVGISIANFFLNGEWLKVVHGRKLFLEICRLAKDKDWKVFLLGATSQVSKEALIALKKKFRGLKIFADPGPRIDKNGEAVSQGDVKVVKDTIDKINKISPDIIFVAFGAPKQEKWVAKWISKINVKGAMVIGGALDYYSGLYKLPPKWMEELELEWLWRLFTQPGRFKRIYNSVVIFPLEILRKKL